MHVPIRFWIFFHALIAFLLFLDLGIFHKKSREISIRHALIMSGFWILLAMLFNAGILFFGNKKASMEFLTGYLTEESLSIDNLFVFITIFRYFNIPSLYQHKILFWGILGAVIMRASFIFAGIVMIQKIHWIIYIFGLFLIITGLKIIFQKEKEIHPEKNPVIKFFKKLFLVKENFSGSSFLIKENGKYIFTPLFIVLLVVESTDILFAVDSVPAVLAITRDPFIAYTSNIFAILGLRALYFAIAGLMKLFYYLHYSISFILIFVGVKMLLSNVYHMPTWIALSTLVGILCLSILASLLFPCSFPKKNKA